MAFISYSVYLLKGTLSEYENNDGYLIKIVKNGFDYKNYTSNSKKLNNNDKGYKLYINEHPKSENNKWAEYLSLENISDDILNTVSPSCIVVVPYKTCVFVLCFGHAAFHINKVLFVEDFGSITALNLIKKDKIKSLDAFSLTSSRKQRIQSSKEEDFIFFSADTDESLIKNVSGSIKNDNSKISRIVGDCGVNVSTSIEVEKIEELIKYLYDSYNKKDEYLKSFPEFNNIIKEKEPALLDELRNKLVDEIKNQSKTSIFLAQPEIEDIYGDYSYFYLFDDKESDSYEKVSYDDLLKFISSEKIPVDKDILKKIFIKMKNNDTGKIKEFNLEEVINYSASIKSNNYYLFSGSWYYINNDFIERLNEYIKKFICLDHDYLQDYVYTAINKNEDKYNKFCANINNKVCLLDKNLIRTSVSPFEAADLLYFPENEKEIYFIHNKLHTHSSTLNHLFTQGFASAKILFNDSAKRAELKKKVKEINKTITKEELSRIDKLESYVFVYGIVDSKINSAEQSRDKIIEYLPLVARIGLQKTIKDFITLGGNSDNIKVCFINMKEIQTLEFMGKILPGSSVTEFFFSKFQVEKEKNLKISFLKILNNHIIKAIALSVDDHNFSVGQVVVLKQGDDKKEFMLIKIVSITAPKTIKTVNKEDVLTTDALKDKNVDKYLSLWKKQFMADLKKKENDEIKLANFEVIYPTY